MKEKVLTHHLKQMEVKVICVRSALCDPVHQLLTSVTLFSSQKQISLNWDNWWIINPA